MLSPWGGKSLALISRDCLRKRREGAALMSPDGKNLPCGASEDEHGRGRSELEL